MLNKNGAIGSEAAKKVALLECSIRPEDAVFTFCRLERDPQGNLYHIVFDACMLCYECYVDSKTAQVRGLFSEPSEIFEAVACVCA